MDDQDEDEPGVFTWAMAAFSVASVGVMLFEVATDASRPAPLLDLSVLIAALIAGIVIIFVLFNFLAGKEIDDDAIENPSWLLRAKYVFAMLFGMAAVVGVIFAYMFWLT